MKWDTLLSFAKESSAKIPCSDDLNDELDDERVRWIANEEAKFVVQVLSVGFCHKILNIKQILMKHFMWALASMAKRNIEREGRKKKDKHKDWNSRLARNGAPESIHIIFTFYIAPFPSSIHVWHWVLIVVDVKGCAFFLPFSFLLASLAHSSYRVAIRSKWDEAMPHAQMKKNIVDSDLMWACLLHATTTITKNCDWNFYHAMSVTKGMLVWNVSCAVIVPSNHERLNFIHTFPNTTAIKWIDLHFSHTLSMMAQDTTTEIF